MRLVYSKTREEVKVGDVVEDTRDGGTFTVQSIEKPRHGGSTGRVYVKHSAGYSQGYYPSVIDAEWIEREDQR